MRRDVVLQAALGLLVLALAYFVGSNTIANLRARGIPLGFEFLFASSGMPVGESFIRYSLADTYLRALAVGLVNTVAVSLIVIVLSSVLGLFIGIARLSTNPAVAGLARIWVELARNTPVVIILLFVYGLFSALPDARAAWQVLPGVFLSQRGLIVPYVELGIPAGQGIGALLAGSLVLTAAVLAARRVHARTGRRPPFVPVAAAGLLAAVLLGFLAGWLRPAVEWPEFRRFNFVGGRELSPEFTTLVAGLTLYTAGFIGEIVRSGILAVGAGQWEGAFALGLRRGQALALVIIPLALRVIVPPLNSQYINVVKNSTLAIVVGYQEFFTITTTVINRTSHALEGIFIILAVYLVLNVALSALMNWWNRKVALVER